MIRTQEKGVFEWNGAVPPARAATRTGREPQPGEAEGEGAAPPHWHSVRFDRLIGLHTRARDVRTSRPRTRGHGSRTGATASPSGSVRFAARRAVTHSRHTHSHTQETRHTVKMQRRSGCGACRSRRAGNALPLPFFYAPSYTQPPCSVGEAPAPASSTPSRLFCRCIYDYAGSGRNLLRARKEAGDASPSRRNRCFCALGAVREVRLPCPASAL